MALVVAGLLAATTGCSSSGPKTSTSAPGGSGGSSAAASAPATADNSHAGTLYDQLPAQYRNGIEEAIIDNYPPDSWLDSNQKLTGIDPEMAEALSKVIGVPINVHTEQFTNMLLGVSSGRYDFAADTTVTAERIKTYDMTTYIQGPYQFLTLADKPAIGQSPLDLCGLALAQLAGDQAIPIMQGWSDQCTSAGKKPIQIVQYPNATAILLSLISGRVAAFPGGVITIGWMAKSRAQNRDWNISGFTFAERRNSFITQKDTGLAPVLEAAVNQLIKDGTYQQIMLKYVPESALITTSETNPQV